MPDQTPLAADPLRQAIASLRGYASQIVRTTQAWVDLEDDEVLYIEGAEDFDRISQSGTAEAIQVRDVSGNITLATRKVLEALVHFWTHKRRNPERMISFRYLTTAGRGREQDSRFGDQLGLDYWDACRSSRMDLQPLREFLAERLGALTKRRGKRESETQRVAREEWNATVTNLAEFVRESPDEHLREDLIRRVTWETASLERSEVLAELEDALVTQGARLLAAKPSLAKKAVPHLLLHVWDLACEDGERALRRADFLRKFEEVVDDVRVPREELNQLRAAASRSDATALPAEPSSSSWYAQVLRNRYAAAREAATAGRLGEADEQLRQLLESLREVASTQDPERRRFEQGILLTRAQNSLRSGNRSGAVTLYQEAAALGPFEDKNRHLAGWVMTNLGRPEEAIEHLDPPDGSSQWQATFAIALIGAGRLDSFRELFGEEQEVDSPDVLLALVRYYVSAKKSVRAEHSARRLVNQDDGTPESRFRAAEAAFTIFQLTVSSPTAPPVDCREWIQILRRIFSDSREVMGGGVPLLRLLVLRRRIEFYELLSEGDEVAKAFRALVEAAPEMAAEVAALGVTTPRDVDLMAAREGARNPVHAAIIDAVHFETDNEVALQRLRELEPSAKGPEREMLLVLLLELAAAEGEETDGLLARTTELSDPITQRIVEAAILRQTHQLERAREVIAAALAEYPESFRLLRVGFGLSRSLGATEEEIDLAERMYARLPAPEFRLLLAESRMRAGDVDGAIREAAAVEAEGARRAKAAYMSAQFALEARRMSDHAAAALRFYEADGSDRAHLYAAMAALRARQYGDAEKLYRGLLESEEREILLNAYGGLAHSIDAQGGGLSSAREQSVAVLIEGYDRLDASPEIAGALYYRALGTRYEKDVHDRIGRDFGSLANLPGMIAIPAEQGLEMIRREQEGVKLRSELLRAGVLPFETAVDLGHRRASYMWFAHRRSRALMIVEPPRFPTRSEEALLPLESLPILLDRTALLMFGETGLLTRVLESDLRLLIETETYDWLAEEEHSLQAEGRPVEREGLRLLFKAVEDLPQIELMRATEVEESILEVFQKSLSWGDSYDLALARREDLLLIDDFVDLGDVPEEERFRVWRSGDLLRALVASEGISLADAARAHEYRPSSLGKSRGGVVSLEHSFLITHGALEAWHECGLLEELASRVGRLFVSPLAERHAREQLSERDADAEALAVVSRIRQSVVEAVDGGGVRLVGRTSSQRAAEAEPELGPEESKALLAGIATPLRRLYEQAVSSGAIICSDDPSVHLYLNPLGPMISGSLDLRQLALSLRAAYPDVEVVGTSVVMIWLEKTGLLAPNDRTAIISDLSAHGRALTGEVAVFASAARDRAGGSADASVLDLTEAMPSALSADVVRRFSPRVTTALAGAITDVWFRDDVSADERTKSVQALIQAFRPWVAPSLPHARSVAEAMWTSLAGALVQRIGTETESLLRLILTDAAKEQEEFLHFLAAAWNAVDVLYGITSEAPVEVRRLGGMLVALLTVASQGVEVHGRPILPGGMMRLAADLFGVKGVLTHTTILRGRSETGEEYLFTVKDQTLEEEAANAINSLAENPPEPSAANTVPVEIEVVSDDGRVKAPFRVSVEVVRILGRLTPPARRFAVMCLSLYYEEYGQDEVAEPLKALAEKISSDNAGIAEAAHRGVLTTILESPRVWAEHDVYRAFSLLREAPIEELEKMAGCPQPWRTGETLRERTVRIRSELSSPDDLLEDVRALWGPFEMAVDQLAGLVTYPEAEKANRESMLSLILMALTADYPYDRVVALGMALILGSMRSDLTEVEIRDLELELWGRPARLAFDGTTQQLLTGLITQWLRNEIEPPEFSDDGIGQWSGEALSLEAIAAAHAMSDRLSVDVTRYTCRAVLSETHDLQARAKAAEAESRDSIGDLLLLGHRLSTVLLPLFIRQARERGFEVMIQDLKDAHEQYPLSQGRIPVREVFVPEVLGVGGEGVNPYLALFLCFLRQLGDVRPGEGDGETLGAVFWWTEDLQEGLEALAQREGPGQLRNLRNLAHTQGVSDRFGSLLTLGVEGHARSLFSLFGGDRPEY